MKAAVRNFALVLLDLLCQFYNHLHDSQQEYKFICVFKDISLFLKAEDKLGPKYVSAGELFSHSILR